MIYMLEDDDGIRNFVIYALNSSGLEAEGFDTPSAFWRRMSVQRPELLLLDIMLPEEDGFSVLAKLRSDSSTRALPVIMLTAKSDELDKVRGLDSGADDYVSKPFGTMELISRIKALLRRTSAGSTSNSELTIGGLTISPSQHKVTAEGNVIALTHKEYDLLLLLVKHREEVLSRDTLLKEVWGYDFCGESRTVDVHIRTLRSKLGRYGDIIHTVRGAGYKAGEPID